MTSLQPLYDEMAAIMARRLPGQGGATAISGLHFTRSVAPTAPAHLARRPSFGLVIQGAQSLQLGDQIHHFSVGEYLLMSIEAPVACRVTTADEAAPHLGLRLTIRPDAVRQVIQRTHLAPATGPRDRSMGATVGRVSSDLAEPTLRLLRLLGVPEDIPALAPLIEQEILYRLVSGPLGGRLLQMSVADTPCARMVQVIDRLKANFNQPLRIDDLASDVSMSASSLQHHFKALTALTPMQYQKQLRLLEARRLMAEERVKSTLAGQRVGYRSPNQFSREYSRLFGSAPAHDVKRARRAAAEI